MGKIINMCNFYTLLLIIFNFRGGLNTFDLLSKTVVFLLILIGLYYTFKLLAYYKLPSVFKGATAFFILMVLYGLFCFITGKVHYVNHYMVFRKVPSFMFLLKILLSFLPLYVFYYFSLIGKITWKWLVFCFFPILISAISQYYLRREMLILEAMAGDTEFTNNESYTLLSLMPFLSFFRKKPVFLFPLLVVISFFIISGMKRGAILIAFICVLYFFYDMIKNSSGRKRVIIIVSILLLGVVLIYFISDLLSNSYYFNYRIQATLEGDSSGRDSLYETFWTAYLDGDLIRKVFGRGAYETLSVGGNFAHQDWLELAVDCGLIGIVAYLLFYFHFFKYIKNTKSDFLNIPLVMCFLILLTKSMFSMGFESIGLELGLVMGYCIANIERTKRDVSKLKIYRT